jgi:hypothetical protein
MGRGVAEADCCQTETVSAASLLYGRRPPALRSQTATSRQLTDTSHLHASAKVAPRASYSTTLVKVYSRLDRMCFPTREELRTCVLLVMIEALTDHELELYRVSDVLGLGEKYGWLQSAYPPGSVRVTVSLNS